MWSLSLSSPLRRRSDCVLSSVLVLAPNCIVVSVFIVVSETVPCVDPFTVVGFGRGESRTCETTA